MSAIFRRTPNKPSPPSAFIRGRGLGEGAWLASTRGIRGGDVSPAFASASHVAIPIAFPLTPALSPNQKSIGGEGEVSP
jgi:hypothetical protein